ncbi:TetR/AcrR family transcriptional regulator [Aquabacterium sp. A7-Y]|uniref:TetR/AcrR family transcriptional regulator n=1 Tax=Aquabacterium sp. A7-Y TaxID=1349605 RepID=UPI00223E058A|nr:TetR/AcrR family transcriptional regulator [Aquabacterium sp. A7-Y]MCW7536820.1 TetR/AcrR family transcriptional regulator [Aquabacterium sp. A7-Y]
MPRIAGRTATPHQLLAAGRELFSRHGYNATGIQQITDRAGVPKGSFYNHFESKEAFAAAIIDGYTAEMLELWSRMMERAPAQPVAAIRYAFEQMIAHKERTASWSGCLVGNLAAEVADSNELCRQRLAAAMTGWREMLASLIRKAQDSGEVRTDADASRLAALVWDAWEGALLRTKLDRSGTPLRESFDLMLNGLLRPPPA